MLVNFNISKRIYLKVEFYNCIYMTYCLIQISIKYLYYKTYIYLNFLKIIENILILYQRYKRLAK